MKKTNLINKNGITLIALVITIIILLVLAGISISMLTGENGILNKVTQAKEENKKVAIEEQIEIAVMGSIGNTGNIEYEMLRDNLNKIDNIIGVPDSINENSFPIVVQIEDSYIKITKDGKVKRKRIPLEYREVEYIESTGTQYMDTGFIPTINSRYELDVQFTDNTIQEMCNGVTNSGSIIGHNYFRFGIGRGNWSSYPNCWYYAVAQNNNYKSNEADLLRHQHFIDLKNGTYGNETITYNQEITQFKQTLSLYLFARHTPIVENDYCYEKVYGCKLYDDDVLVREFIPCYNTQTNEIGMYDLVNNVFYINKGTGTFIKGNDI